MNERAEQNADILGKLTVVGTIVLPMNIITGMWGMNVYVPGQTGDDVEESSTKKRAAAKPPQPDSWACQVCTYINPRRFLACDACGMECPLFKERSISSLRAPSSNERTAITRPPKALEDKKKPKEGLGWNCRECGTFVEHMWWCCTLCGLMKDRS